MPVVVRHDRPSEVANCTLGATYSFASIAAIGEKFHPESSTAEIRDDSGM
jgi:hypothetical protein